MIIAARNFFEKENENIRQTNTPLIPFTQIQQRTAAALGVSKNTVWRVTMEKFNSPEESSKLSTPGKKRSRKSAVTDLDSFQEDAIRRHVYDYYIRREHPTVKKLLVSLRECDLFSGGYSSLYKVLHNLGFEYKRINGRKLLMERGDIVTLRCTFLKNIQGVNLQEVVWLDETWVNAGHTRTKGWSDDTVKGSMPGPTGKGGRFIVLHAGTSHGFVGGALLLFKSKKTVDYHEEMDHDRFCRWFKEQLLPNIEEKRVIVMDNAPYHSVQVDKAPTLATRKEEMLNWLVRHGVQADPILPKGALLGIVKDIKPRTPTYYVDELAKQHGHQVIRLPPYHCHYSAIELIWSQVKGHVAANNKTFSLREVEKLIVEGVEKVDAEDWKKAVAHIEKEIRKASERESVLDNAIDSIIIRVGDSSNSSSDATSDSEGSGSEVDMEGIVPLPVD